ncbi:MAG: hypothetical protein C5B50_28220 [Verrucomicrobia bacterium]|nr:MAG: hypothetical protein C5B50_28220 [Verrucomicrobiota bacterium]
MHPLPEVVVAQKGAREHFLAARAFHRLGMLRKLVVDWYAPESRALRCVLSGLGGQRAASALSAQCAEIPAEFVRPMRGLGVWSKWVERRASCNGGVYRGFTRTDAAFGRSVARLRLPEHDVFFGYSYASLEALEAARRSGRLTIVDQIDPGPAEFRLVAEEMQRWPELSGLPLEFPASYFGRAKREWEFADVILVNSDWTREAIIAEGADPAKIEVVPLAYEAEGRGSGVGGAGEGFRVQGSGKERRLSRGLRVLWLGQVNVRKGIHYLLEAARLLKDECVEFQVAGPCHIRPEVTQRAASSVRWLGPIPRSQVSRLYQECDLFVLPTLSDGFAITQLEALAHGLPVITTTNCGRVVEEGKTGFIVPARNSGALADAIIKFVRNRDLALSMAPACRAAAKAFSIEAYGRKLAEVIEKRM